MRGALLLCILRAVGAFTPLHMERARKVARMAAAADSEWALPALAKLPRASLALRRVEPGSAALAAAAALETASYPADEAASPARLAERASVAGEFFLGLFDVSAGAARAAADAPLVGFVCATAAPLAGGLTEAAMGAHDAAGELLCVHSVVVAPRWRRQGVASAMLRAYLRAVAGGGGGGAGAGATAPRVRACALIAKARLVGLYARAGFELVGQSAIVHGADPWFELRCDLEPLRADGARDGAGAGAAMLQCDAFTAAAFGGNPAAVVFTTRGGDAAWMQSVALENNLSETAFVEPIDDAAEGDEDGAAPQRFAIRWFTPACEVALCGHATLGAAHALWATGRASADAPIEFATRESGTLACAPCDDRAGRGGTIAMDFPADAPAPLDAASALADGAGSAALADVLAAGLKLPSPASAGAWPAGVRAVARGRFDLLVELEPEAFDALETDGTALAKIDTRGVVPTCAGAGADAARAAAAGAPEVDFRSRFFGPRIDVTEDPVTGSAHCMLAPYWAARLGRDAQGAPAPAVVGFQASARGGVVRCELAADRVRLLGQAVTTLTAELAM